MVGAEIPPGRAEALFCLFMREPCRGELNCTVTPFSAFAEDESGEYEYEFERASLKAAIREAVADGALDQELNLIGTYVDEYAELLEADGSLYEVFPEVIDEERDRDRALDLRIFARIEGSIPVDDTYVFDGSEELIFLLAKARVLSSGICTTCRPREMRGH